MGSQRDELLSYIDRPDELFTVPHDELRPLQMAAATEALQELRADIPVLDRRARDTGLEEVRTEEDVVPLLFAHTTYKSYPEQYLARGEWKKLELWLSTLTAVPFDDVDSSSVTNIDEWLDCLWEAGHCVYPSSGTSGKFSFTDMSREDLELMWRGFLNLFGWPEPAHLNHSVRLYQLGPSRGPNRQIHVAEEYAKHFAKPGEVQVLSNEPLKMSQVRDAVMMRRAIMDGTARPEEVAAFEERAKQRAKVMSDAMRTLTDDMLEHRDESLLVAGMWGQHWGVLECARASGVPDGTFSAGSFVTGHGGNKGNTLPADFKQQLLNFYASARPSNLAYGMSEMTVPMQLCEADRYHAPPWLVVIQLDKNGEQPLPREGVTEGRFAFLDLLLRGRWGGLISGDKVTIDYTDKCACGRPGPVLLPIVDRYSDIGDDRITCAGTFDAYIRGMVE